MSLPMTTRDSLELRKYQREGIDFLVRQGRAILADEQGVGKTVQALVAARVLVPKGQGRILIVSPKSAAGVWIDEIAKWLGEEGLTYQGTSRAYDVLDNAPIVITNYSLLKEVFERHPHWSLIIFDEAHKLRGWRPLSKRSTYKFLNRGSSKYKFFLTGTPIFSNAGDLWPLLHQIRPDVFKSYWAFVEQWCHIDNNGFGNVIIGTKNSRSLHAGLKKHGFMIRRLKKDVMPELPPKTRMEWSLEMTPMQAKDYTRLAKDMMLDFDDHTLTVPNKIALVLRLRQLLVSPRILGLDYDGAAIDALREELSEANSASIVFTPFPTAGLPVMMDAFAKLGRPIEVVHKDLNPEQLRMTINRFQHNVDKREPILLSSLLLGTSWTATRATQAYFIGYDWSPSNNFQAEDRLHRHGQKYATTIKYAMHHGTIDEHVMDILNNKVSIQKAILDPERFLFGKSSARAA